MITKTNILKYLQCVKASWMENHVDPTLFVADKEELFDLGKEVEKEAYQLFPDGILIKEIFAEGKIKETTRLLQEEHCVLFQSGFAFEGVFAGPDIIVKENEKLELYEVKSGTRLKPQYLDDLAIQAWVLKNCGVMVNKLFLIHINDEYIREGELEREKLFVLKDLTQEVLPRIDFIAHTIQEIKLNMDSGCPDIPIGEHCDSPYECPYKKECWKEVPSYSVLNISRLDKKRKFALYHQGLHYFHQLSPEVLSKMTERQVIQIEAELFQKSCIHPDKIGKFLATLSYPLYFIDFETYQTPIPPFNHLKPYEHIPFQFSLHVQEKAFGKTKHFEFLSQAGHDPREKIARQLISIIGGDGSVIAYNSGFEKKIIRDLAQFFPEYSEKLLQINERFKDLMFPFMNYYYYTPRMRGSYSIKSILPALLPELTYKGMEISNGRQAMEEFRGLIYVNDPKEVQKIRANLLEYCKLDTLAMVKILEKLKEIASPQYSLF